MGEKAATRQGSVERLVAGPTGECEAIEILTLGSFQVRRQGLIISDGTRRARKLWSLFNYLLLQRGMSASQEALLDLLWAEETCEDPGHALRTLVYRLRRLLLGSTSFKGENTHILSTPGGYSFNTAAPYLLDAESFENLCARASGLTGADHLAEAISVYRKALDLYRGDYLLEFSEDWVIPVRTYYRDLYIKSVLALIGLFKKSGDDNGIILILNRALLVEPLEEEFHLALLKALIRAGRIRQAREHYTDISAFFDRKLGTGLSADMEQLLALAGEDISMAGADLPLIRERLSGKESSAGAFMCTPDHFHAFYRLEVNRQQRNSLPSFLCLLHFEPLPAAAQNSSRQSLLEEVLCRNLRKGDIVCRWSHSSYLLLLPGLSYGDAGKVIRRLKASYSRESGSSTLLLRDSLMPLSPLSVSEGNLS